jgi:hypothetical protein
MPDTVHAPEARLDHGHAARSPDMGGHFTDQQRGAPFPDDARRQLPYRFAAEVRIDGHVTSAGNLPSGNLGYGQASPWGRWPLLRRADVTGCALRKGLRLMAWGK